MPPSAARPSGVLITQKILLKISQNNLGNQEITWATWFSTMGGPVGNPSIWAYPQHLSYHGLSLSICMAVGLLVCLYELECLFDFFKTCASMAGINSFLVFMKNLDEFDHGSLDMNIMDQTAISTLFALLKSFSVFKISAGPRTLTGKIWVGPASFPSLSYIHFCKIVLRSGKFQILFRRLHFWS